MRKILVCLLLLLSCLPPAAAQAKAGEPDRGFAHRGKLALLIAAPPEGNNDFVGLAWGGGGKIVVSAAQRLIEYLPDGSMNPDFGEAGQLEVVSPSGGRPALHGLAVDSHGRILVAGDENGSLLLARYLPDGRLDRSFGDQGWTITDLGLPAPTTPPAEPFFPTPPTSATTLLRATGLLLDSAGRPLVTGAWQEAFQLCYPLVWQGRHKGFVARFQENGSIDRGFDTDGVRIDPDSQEDFAPARDSSGIVFLGANSDCLRGGTPNPVLNRVLPSGAVDESFGAGGKVELPFYVESPTFVQDRFERKLLIGPPETSLATLMRLRPRGSLDSRFGGGEGKVLLALPQEVPALAADRKGRAVIGTSEQRSAQGTSIVLRRRLVNGGRDRSFGGRDGKATIRFGGIVSAEKILIGGSGKILVAGQLRKSGAYGFALARFRGR